MTPAKIACAVYTRKSSEEGLEQDFNSLDAQREACEAYVLSQKALGWTLLPTTFDDGGFSGGNVERPALQRLLAEIAARRVQVVVVYKVDRLTRSLADFAKMVELFDAHGVSFVSVTQQFNTTTSMGRLTLNVLLSFAQFEREVTAERIRDKIAASKRKGMWMGGLCPVGYAHKDRSLLIDEAQAPRIRQIYQLYLELNCVGQLKEELDRRGWVTPARTTKRPGAAGSRPYSRGHLYGILSNPIYAGMIQHKGQVFTGSHPPIIESELWQSVQERLRSNRQGQKTRTHAAQPSLLAGLVFDETGARMTPSHAKKGAKRYRYYIGSTSDKEAVRVPALELESAVTAALVNWLRDEARVLPLLLTSDTRAAKQSLRRARELAESIETAPRVHLATCISRLDMTAEALVISFRLAALSGESAPPDERLTQIDVPARLKRCGLAMRLIVRDSAAGDRRPVDPKLRGLLARAYRWVAELTSGRVNTLEALARAEGVTASYVGRVIQLAMLDPEIVQRIADNKHPPELSADRLIRMLPLPEDWAQQRVILGFN